MRIYPLFLLFFAIFTNGCAPKVAPPTDSMSNAKIALIRAKDFAASILDIKEYKNAQSYYKRAKVYMDNKKFSYANQMAQKAHIEANLASEKAKNVKLQQKVDKLSGKINLITKDFAVISK